MAVSPCAAVANSLSAVGYKSYPHAKAGMLIDAAAIHTEASASPRLSRRYVADWRRCQPTSAADLKATVTATHIGSGIASA